MSYATANPPQLMVARIGSGIAQWAYKSTNSTTEVLASGFFSNGDALGMETGDLVFTTPSTGGIPSVMAVTTVVASSAATVVRSS